MMILDFALEDRISILAFNQLYIIWATKVANTAHYWCYQDCSYHWPKHLSTYFRFLLLQFILVIMLLIYNGFSFNN